ncbi:hypothetical protein VZT92_000980 [Zoarces viviparus]|uniref:Uncharacterized protein n=1 Tax=Zoarces viviparus TaxID=48416 RepID=A0AAW1G7F2_ZOAVI
MPKTQDKGSSAVKANNIEADQASNQSEAAEGRRSPGTSIDPSDIIRAIKELKTDLKGDNDCLRQEIIHMGQEINGKLDNLVTEMQSLSDRVGEAETRVEQVEGWAVEATGAICTCLEQQRILQQKLTDLESRSRRNNMRLFGVAEGEEGNSVPQFIVKLLRSELPLPQELDLKI